MAEHAHGGLALRGPVLNEIRDRQPGSGSTTRRRSASALRVICSFKSAALPMSGTTLTNAGST